MNILALIRNLAGPEGLFILLVIVLLFGGKKLPELGRSVGEAIREFSKGKNEQEEEKKKP
jgi:sec-independent protein translocase protein TatA